MIDTHAHLQHNKYRTDRNEVLNNAAAKGLTAIIIPGISLDDSREAVTLTERYATANCAVYASVGVHPTEAHTLTPATLIALRKLAQRTIKGVSRIVAIGETGLDYYWPKQHNRRWLCAEPGEQRLAFKAHLRLAAEMGLPVIVHDRDAHADTLRLLQDWVAGGSGRTGVLHAYAGRPECLTAALDLGFYIGMDGPVTFKKATKLHEVARQVPLERLLLETDAPYLTPHPYRGRRNEPAYLHYIAARIAALRHTTVKTIEKATTANAQRLFGLNM